MRNLAERVTRFRPLQVFLYWLPIPGADHALTFPLVLYEGYFREHQYGLSNQTFGEWMGDCSRGWPSGSCWAASRDRGDLRDLPQGPRTWWIWGTVAAVAFLVVGHR